MTDTKQTNEHSDESLVTSPEQQGRRGSKKKRLIIWSSVALALVSGIIVLIITTNASRNNTATSPQTSGSTSTAELLTSQGLQCVPRGHDNYRTNNTLAIDPKNPETLYIGVEYKGVYKSTDGGTSWKQSDTGVRGYAMEADTAKKCVQELGRIIIDPTNSNRLLLSRVETPSTLSMMFGETAGLYESQDAGKTWKQIITKDMNASGSRAIAFAPNDSNTIYYGVNNMNPSFKPDGKPIEQLFNKSGILYRTTDNGGSWSELPTGAEKGFRTSGVFVDRNNANAIWLATLNQDDHGGFDASNQKGFLKTLDGGKTWQTISVGAPLGDATVAPQSFNHAFAPTQTTSGPPAAYYSTDGSSFPKSEKYMHTARYDSHDLTGMRLIGYAPFENPIGLYESTDGGKSWKFYANVPPEVDNADKFGVRIEEIVWHPTDKNIVYMSGSGGYAWKSTDGGKTWTTILTLDKIGGPNKNKAGSLKSSEQDQ